MDKKRKIFYIKNSIKSIFFLSPLMILLFYIIKDHWGNIKLHIEPLIVPIGYALAIIITSVMFAGGLYHLFFMIKEVKLDLRDAELKKQGMIICRSCKGYGCHRCKGNGTIDWVKGITKAQG